VASTSKSIGSAFSSIDIANSSLVSDITLLSKQMGITSDRSVGFLKTIGGIKGQSAVANKNMLGLAGASAKAYGVGLDDVMADVANASEEARMYAGKNADEMVRAAAQARQMGTTLDSMSRAAKGLLDFESSIQAELKASALIGKNINFNEARRLAFQGKVVEANKLILDQAKKIKFNQLNPIAQEAFAKAAGKTVKELQDMLESESRMKSALTSNNKEVREAAKAQLEKQNLKKSNANRNLMETLQMVVSHEIGHFQGLLSHSRRCVDVLSYYTNDAGEKCSIRDNGVMPKNFEYCALLPTACDIQRCLASNSKQ